MTRELTPADVFPTTIGNDPAVQIDRQIDRVAILGTLNIVEGSWRFKLVDLRTPPQRATGWFSLRDPRALQTHRRATSLRNQMGAEFGDQWRDILEWVILRFQDHETDFEVEIHEPEAEAEQEDAEPEAEPEEQLSDEEEEEIVRILGSTHALYLIKNHLDNIIAGEDENKQILFLLLLSGKAESPRMKQMILLKGEAGAGKTTLMTIADLFNTKDVGRFTKHALDYSEMEGYEVLRLKEFGKMDEEDSGVSTIKFLSGDDEGYTVEYTVRDDGSGEMTTEQKRIEPITVISSTTRIELDNQYERRNWIISPDESQKQTERVRRWTKRHEDQADAVALGLRNETDYDRSKRILQHLVRRIEMCDCIVPFKNSITKILKSPHLRVRGDFKKVITLVKLYGILQQNILPPVTTEDGVRKVFMTPEKAIEILQIAILPLTTMSANIDKRQRKIIELMEKFGHTEVNHVITKAARDQMAIHDPSINSDTARKYLNILENNGWLSGEQAGRTKQHKMLLSLDAIKRRLSAVAEQLNEPDKLLQKMREEATEYFNNINLPGDPNYQGVLDEENPYVQQLHHMRYLFSTNNYTDEYPLSSPELVTTASETEREITQAQTQAEQHQTHEHNQEQQEMNFESLQEELDFLLELGQRIMADSNGEPVTTATVMEHLPEDYDQMQVASLLRTLARDGYIYQPSPGRWMWEV